MADAYSTLVLASSPTAYYRLDDTGSTAVDSSGSAGGPFNMTVGANVAESQTGLLDPRESIDTCMLVPGSGTGQTAADCITGVRVTQLEATTAVTVEVWIKPTAATLAAVQCAAVQYASSVGTPYMMVTSNGKVSWNCRVASNLKTVTSALTLVAGTTYHLVGVYDGSNVTLYINGASNGTPVAATGSINGYSASTLPYIGQRVGFGATAFQGNIDEVAIYANQALSAATILRHYNLGAGVGLVNSSGAAVVVVLSGVPAGTGGTQIINQTSLAGITLTGAGGNTLGSGGLAGITLTGSGSSFPLAALLSSGNAGFTLTGAGSNTIDQGDLAGITLIGSGSSSILALVPSSGLANILFTGSGVSVLNTPFLSSGIAPLILLGFGSGTPEAVFLSSGIAQIVFTGSGQTSPRTPPHPAFPSESVAQEPICTWRFFCPSIRMGSQFSEGEPPNVYTSSPRMCPKYQRTATPQVATTGCFWVLPDLPGQSAEEIFNGPGRTNPFPQPPLSEFQ